MIRANIKDIEAAVTRFINDLNRDTTHIVELHHYVKMEKVHMTMKVEEQLKQKGTIWQSQPLDPLTPWKPDLKTNIRGGPSQPN